MELIISFLPLVSILIFLAIIVFVIYIIVTILKLMKQDNEYLKEIRDELRKNNSKY